MSVAPHLRALIATTVEKGARFTVYRGAGAVVVVATDDKAKRIIEAAIAGLQASPPPASPRDELRAMMDRARTDALKGFGL